jgi:flagellar protein FlbD
MIKMTRLQGTEIYLNPDLILSLEATPDTVVTLTNGEKYVLRDNLETILDRFLDYKRAIGMPKVSTVPNLD